MKIGLLLEGGAMRGLYSAGLLDVLLDMDLPVTEIVSVSAGALFGVNYPSKQQGRAIRYSARYAIEPRFMGMAQLVRTGNIVSKDFAYYEVPFHLDPFDQETFASSGINFYATVTNVATGEAEHHLITNVFDQMEVLRASSAMPLLSKIVEIDGQGYLDGGIADPIPLNKLLSLDVDKVIAILTRPADYRKKVSSSVVYQRVYRAYPEFVTAWKKRAQKYNDTLDQLSHLEGQGKAFVFRPSKNLHLARLEKDPNKLRAMYSLGVEDASSHRTQLMTYLSQN